MKVEKGLRDLSGDELSVTVKEISNPHARQVNQKAYEAYLRFLQTQDEQLTFGEYCAAYC